MTAMFTKEAIRELIEKNDNAVRRGLIALYEYQTYTEKQLQTTNNNNNVGFNHADAKKLSGIAEWTIKTGFLTEKQTALVRKKILKYAGQLARIANENKKAA